MEFIYLDIDDNNTAQLQRQFGFRYQPHLILLDGKGNVVQEFVESAAGRGALREALDNLLALEGE